jgi:bla regulator protein blaR1
MIAWLIESFVAFTLLVLLVLALRKPVARLFGAGWAYALWALPLLRLLIPDIDLFGFSAQIEIPAYALAALPEGAAAISGAHVAEDGASILPWLLALWLGGVALFAAWQQSTYSAFMLGLGRGRRSEPAEHGGIPVVESDTVDGPLAVGLIERRIVVPVDFRTRYNPAERRLALEHELVHHRRGDLWWNLAALMMLGLNWFNPVAWIAFRAFRADQELACDEAVAGCMPVQGRCDYASALVKAATRPGQLAACPLNSADQLKARLRMMKCHRRTKLRAAGGLATFALLAAGTALTTGTAAVAAKEEVKRLPAVTTAAQALLPHGESIPLGSTETTACEGHCAEPAAVVPRARPQQKVKAAAAPERPVIAEEVRGKAEQPLQLAETAPVEGQRVVVLVASSRDGDGEASKVARIQEMRVTRTVRVNTLAGPEGPFRGVEELPPEIRDRILALRSGDLPKMVTFRTVP